MRDFKENFGINLLTGGISGIIGTTAIFPIDLIKTRLQNSRGYSSPLTLSAHVMKTEGIRGFYRGLLANLVGVAPEKAIKLAANDFFRGILVKVSDKAQGNPDKLPTGFGMLAGALAGTTQVIATNPMETVKIRMQMATIATTRSSRSGSIIVQQLPTTLSIVKDLGIKGLYRGSFATLSRDVPFSMIFFQLFASFKNIIAERTKDGELEFSHIFASGISAGAIGAFLVTPMDVVKTRYQATRSSKDLFSIYQFEPRGKFGVISSSDCNIIYRKNGKEIISGTLESFSSWNLRSGSLISTWNDSENKCTVTCIQASPNDMDVLAVGYEDGSVRIWNLEQKESTVVLNGHKTAVTALSFDPSGTRLASGSKDTDLVLWDLASETGLYRLRGHNNAITSLTFLTNDHIVSASKDSLIKLWDLQAQHCVETIVSHRSEVSSFFFTVDKSMMLTVGADQFIRLFGVDLKALDKKLKAGSDVVENVFNLLGEVQKSSKDRALQVQVHHEMNMFCVLSNDRSVEVFKFSTAEDVKKKLQRRRKRQKSKKEDSEEIVEVEDSEFSVEPNDLVKSVRFFRLENRAKSFSIGNASLSRKSFRIAFGYTSNCIEEWEVYLDDGEKEPEVSSSIDLPGHRSDVKAVSVSSDSNLIASASLESVKIWNSESGTCIRTLECENTLSVQFIQSNEYVLLGTREGTLRIFEVATGTETDTIDAHSGAIWSIAMRPDKKGFATGSADKSVKFWEFKNSATRAEGFKLKHIRSLQVADDVLCVKYSPDCRYVAVSLLDLTVKVFFEDTLKFYLNLFGHKLPVMAIDISFDSKILISGSADKNIKVWGLDFGDCRKSLFANQDSITGLAFLPRTYQFISTGKDGVVKYWTDDQYSLLQKLEGHRGEIWSMALSPRGNILVTVSSDRSIRVWDRTDEQLFLEEERENQMEEMLESSMLTGNSHDEMTDKNEEVGISTKKTLDTLRATEKLADAIDAADEELEKWEIYEEERRRGVTGINPPAPGPYFETVARGKTPAELVLMTFSQIPAIELEMALLSLPFTHIKSLFKYIQTWFYGNMNISLSSRILSCLIRLYFTQLVADTKLRTALEEIRRLQKEKLSEFRDLLGVNGKMIKVYLKNYEADHLKTIS